MNENQKGKLERYLKNSKRFLWALGPGNQKLTYKWLRKIGLEFNDSNYSDVINQLLITYGIEKVINIAIIPRVNELFPKEAIDFLRRSWNASARPDIAFSKLFNIEGLSPFLEVNTQYHYVEGWGELAGVWFEEIEQIPEFKDNILGKKNA